MSELQAELRAPLSGSVIFARYVLFALVSGLANLGTQELVIRALPQAPIMASILTGTGIGFAVKYGLDKHLIFLDGYDGHAAEIRKILVYGVFSVATTLLFWAVELGFLYVWKTDTAKYLGAAIGLAVGNAIKYLLDRHFVFPRAAA